MPRDRRFATARLKSRPPTTRFPSSVVVVSSATDVAPSLATVSFLRRSSLSGGRFAEHTGPKGLKPRNRALRKARLKSRPPEVAEFVLPLNSFATSTNIGGRKKVWAEAISSQPTWITRVGEAGYLRLKSPMKLAP